MTTIIGRLVVLSRGRIVFLAPHPADAGSNCVGFISEAGEETRLVLSDEAIDALVAMRTDPVVGTPERAFPSKPKKPEWRWRETKTAPAPQGSAEDGK